MLKRFFWNFLFFFLISGSALFAQTDQRTRTTKIADLLAQFPAENAQELDAHMQDMAALQADGLVEMTLLLSPPGQGDNTALEYALGGFSAYVTQPGHETWRAMSVQAYCQALGQVAHDENRAFLIRQLQVVGKDDAVPCLQTYLQNDALCGPAARALTTIQTSAAKQALLNALQTARGTCQLSLVEALGDARATEAVATLTPLAKSQDVTLRKLALSALANIADPASESVLLPAAEKEVFTYADDEATAALLRYAARLAEEGQTAHAEKLAQTLVGRATENQIHTRTAALRLLTELKGAQSVPLLVAAAQDTHPEYRAAALQFAMPYARATSAQWIAALKKAQPDAQAAILTMLEKNDATDALPIALKSLKSKDEAVQRAAIGAAGRLGKLDALPDLLKVMKKGTPTQIQAVADALRLMPGEGLSDQIVEALPKLPAPAQAALLSVVGARATPGKINDVFAYVSASDTTVRMAALRALAPMATANDFPTLVAQLNQTTPASEVAALQQAVVASVEAMPDSSTRVAQVLQAMENAPAGKQADYFAILAALGGDEALDAVTTGFANGDDATKRAAVAALAHWSDVGATAALYDLGRQSENKAYLDEALRGYVGMIQRSTAPDAQKLLMLRNAMALAQTPEQKQLILNETARNRTFPALPFAGQYLDDPAVRQAAAQAVVRIALANPDFQGDLVRQLLQKTMQVMQGGDSDYEKEAIRKHLAEMPAGEGFVALFNGKDLTGWKGLVENPIARANMKPAELAEKQAAADQEMRDGWQVLDNGELLFTGHGNNLATIKQYGDFEMLVDWKIYDDGKGDGDAGIYLRGAPQVQIWDTSRTNVGAQVGSGGLYNNQVHPSKPLKVADNPLGEWNHFRILMQGDRVTVYLNGELVTDNVILENYWDRNQPIFPTEQIELQAHGSRIGYRNIYLRELPRQEPFELSAQEKKEGYKVLFDGTNMYAWTGNTQDYVIEDGVMVVKPSEGSGGNLYTKEEYSDFVFRFEFKLTPGANNGLGIRTPLEGDAAYVGMELQILDNTADIYKNLHEYQYHGSVYGVIPAKRGYLKPVGEWNEEEVTVKGTKIKIVLNGTTILDGDIANARKNGTLDHKDHPGLKNDKGHIGFLGHGSVVYFRNIRIKDLSKKK
ncbi:HEAT repeat [Catalinimonas alkaloidigena]|uniref:HEAT repeat n=1 Tax=Catalinimonas alkaloidigena TaxID=1075417 RepID=A0A1G9UCG5_9BACT|nr:family 16 glycoside hydrolase [Catalinimonas alkaloidigena]SDM57657.1 HEAT repeat [Catalinimonas alkaloidigena]